MRTILKQIATRKRRFTQWLCAILYNCHFAGFSRGAIYKGSLKTLCVPGLNCYSCPGAVASCPLGSLQSALVSAKYKFPYYILGMLLFFGVLLGRFVCGFLCPFGLLQELLYRLPTKKIRKGTWSRRLSLLKYLLLALFVIGIPLALSVPGFCKYICPAGTLEAGIPLVLTNESLRALAGQLFTWKLLILAAIVISAVSIFRSFCRFLCPLGAFYSLFHRVAAVRIHVEESRCIGCGICVNACKMDIRAVGDRECIQCGDCRSSCPCHAIDYPLFRRNAYSETLLPRESSAR